MTVTKLLDTPLHPRSVPVLCAEPVRCGHRGCQPLAPASRSFGSARAFFSPRGRFAMSEPILSAEAGLGQSVPTIAFQANSQVVSVVGQKLKFNPCTGLTDPDATVWHAGNSPHGISLVATCPKAQLFAFSERTLEPKIYICSYPDMLQQMTLELPADRK